jgi:endonuclease YncB( thermonuclease family)
MSISSKRASRAVLVAAALVLGAGPVLAEPIAPADVRVIDGDTIRVYHKSPDVRLVGFNAPETRRAQLYAEEQLGARATRRLRELFRLAASTFAMLPVPARLARRGRRRATTAGHAAYCARTAATLVTS